MDNQQIHRIFVHICTAVCELVDVDRFYIALYEQRYEQVSFPLVWEGEKHLQDEQPPWIERNLNKRWLIDQALLQNTAMRLKPDVIYWPEGEERPKSWLAVPVTISDELKILLVAENWRRADSFGEDALRFLDTISRQAAMSIRNVQLAHDWQESEKKRRAAEKFMAVNLIAGEFAHSMNNTVGTIPIWSKLARTNLDPNDPKQAIVLKQLDEIDISIRRLLKKAGEIKEATQQRAREPIDVNTLVENALKRAWDSQPNINERILIETALASGLPQIEVERDNFIDALTSIAKNGLESMSGRGILKVSTRQTIKEKKESIEIIFSDSGAGILKKDIDNIFDPFFTTKATGMGFGLWRDKTVIEAFGGRIEVESEVSKGTTFIITLPVK